MYDRSLFVLGAECPLSTVSAFLKSKESAYQARYVFMGALSRDRLDVCQLIVDRIPGFKVLDKYQQYAASDASLAFVKSRSDNSSAKLQLYEALRISRFQTATGALNGYKDIIQHNINKFVNAAANNSNPVMMHFLSDNYDLKSCLYDAFYTVVDSNSIAHACVLVTNKSFAYDQLDMYRLCWTASLEMLHSLVDCGLPVAEFVAIRMDNSGAFIATAKLDTLFDQYVDMAARWKSGSVLNQLAGVDADQLCRSLSQKIDNTIDTSFLAYMIDYLIYYNNVKYLDVHKYVSMRRPRYMDIVKMTEIECSEFAIRAVAERDSNMVSALLVRNAKQFSNVHLSDGDISFLIHCGMNPDAFIQKGRICAIRFMVQTKRTANYLDRTADTKKTKF